MGATFTGGWPQIEAWLNSDDAEWMIVSAMLGDLSSHEVEEVMLNAGLEWTSENRREFRRLLYRATEWVDDIRSVV